MRKIFNNESSTNRKKVCDFVEICFFGDLKINILCKKSRNLNFDSLKLEICLTFLE